MEAKDVMTTNVITMSPKTSVMEAIDILVESKISGAPVVDEDQKVVGIITEKDIMVAMDFIGERNSDEVCVEEFMTREILSFSKDTPIRELMKVLVSRNIKRVPILENEKIVGIVARRDVLISIKQKQ